MKGNYDLKKDSVNKLFAKYAFMSIMGLTVMSLHVILDGIFIGRGVGSMGLAAVNIAGVIYPILTALGLCFGFGAATMISIKFGENKVEEANSIFNQTIIFSTIFSLVFSVLCITFLTPLSYLFGSNKALLPGVKVYLGTFMVFTVFYVVMLILDPIVRNDGNPKTPMYACIMSAVVNSILNYLFIFVFQWGLFGAALATGLAQVVSLIYLMFHFFKKKGKLRFQKTKVERDIVIQVFKTGSPLLASQGCLAIFMIIYNWVVIRHIGEMGVASLGIILYVQEMIAMVLYGIGEALQPIASYNLGAKQYDRVKQVFKTSIISGVVISAVFLVITLFASENIVSWFNKEAELIALTSYAMKLFFSAVVFYGINMVIIAYFQAIDRPTESTILSLLQGIILCVALLFILPYFIGENGIWLSFPIGNMLTFLVAIYYIRKPAIRSSEGPIIQGYKKTA
ncbi:MAG: MATE family efflux transporter [Clostridia bacterium]|nr:MATE family efflux transporter [Clostridia bacterium]